jgi:protoporphyrinogen oxidase
MERVRHLIVGAGISGLAYADKLGTSEDYLVIEADKEVGGYCKTITKEGFTWDYSGHFFHFKHKDIESHLVSRMQGQRVLTIQKDSRIHWAEENGQKRWVDFPFQKNIHQLPQADFIDCLYELYLRDERSGVPQGEKAKSFLEMLYQRFGRGITERFLRPYNEKLYATDLSKLDVDAMGRFFPYADMKDIIRNMKEADNASYNAAFTYPEGGAIQYVHALLQGVDASRVSLQEGLVSIDLKNKVATTTKREIAFEHLVSSAPFVKLLDMTSVIYDASAYTWNKVLVFNLGFDKKGPESIHWAYFPQRDVSFYRVGFYDNIFGTPRMSLYVELGYAKDAVIDEAEVARARARVLADLAKVGLVDGHQVVAEHHVVMDPAYVHITQHSLHDVAKKRRILESRGVHTMGRYGSWTYCSIEDNIVEARALADMVKTAW